MFPFLLLWHECMTDRYIGIYGQIIQLIIPYMAYMYMHVVAVPCAKFADLYDKQVFI